MKNENATLNEYRKIHITSLSIFLLVTQILYHVKTINTLTTGNEFIDFVVGILISTATYSFIYGVLSFIWEKIWNHIHKDDLYIQGIWWHVFNREVDDDKEYVRGGWLKITQNFYDISVDAYNRNVEMYLGGDNKYYLRVNEKNNSHWEFKSCIEGNVIYARFQKHNASPTMVSDRGTMTWFLQRNSPKEINGTFSDSGKSSIMGSMNLYKGEMPVDKKELDIVKDAPSEWKKYIINILKKRRIYNMNQHNKKRG